MEEYQVFLQKYEKFDIVRIYNQKPPFTHILGFRTESRLISEDEEIMLSDLVVEFLLDNKKVITKDGTYIFVRKEVIFSENVKLTKCYVKLEENSKDNKVTLDAGQIRTMQLEVDKVFLTQEAKYDKELGDEQRRTFKIIKAQNEENNKLSNLLIETREQWELDKKRFRRGRDEAAHKINKLKNWLWITSVSAILIGVIGLVF